MGFWDIIGYIGDSISPIAELIYDYAAHYWYLTALGVLIFIIGLFVMVVKG
jgi:hypothetical protein